MAEDALIYACVCIQQSILYILLKAVVFTVCLTGMSSFLLGPAGTTRWGIKNIMCAIVGRLVELCWNPLVYACLPQIFTDSMLQFGLV